MSPTNVLLLTVLVEVRTESTDSIKFNHACVSSSPFYAPPPPPFCVCLQHVLILVKLILRVLIPDEPGWIRKKREHIEFTSMQALKQQVGSRTFAFQFFGILLKIWRTSFSCLFRSCPRKTPECISSVGGVASCCHVPKLLQSEDRVPTSVFIASEGSKVSGRDLTSLLCASNAPHVHVLSASAASYRITQCFCLCTDSDVTTASAIWTAALKYYVSNIRRQMRCFVCAFRNDRGVFTGLYSVLSLCGQIRSGQSICVWEYVFNAALMNRIWERDDLRSTQLNRTFFFFSSWG